MPGVTQQLCHSVIHPVRHFFVHAGFHKYLQFTLTDALLYLMQQPAGIGRYCFTLIHITARPPE
ncbi:hypothetical protein D3C80_2189770 [compost metagenome]